MAWQRASPYPPSTREIFLGGGGIKSLDTLGAGTASGVCTQNVELASARLPTGVVVGQFALNARRYKAQ